MVKRVSGWVLVLRICMSMNLGQERNWDVQGYVVYLMDIAGVSMSPVPCKYPLQTYTPSPSALCNGFIPISHVCSCRSVYIDLSICFARYFSRTIYVRRDYDLFQIPSFIN